METRNVKKTETRTKEIKTVERTLVVKLPERFDKELQVIAKALDRTVESILKDELYGNLENWYSGGFAQGWAEEICCYTVEAGQKFEKEISQVADADDC
jgi:hypothetical protein